ncbi:hypothetical protein TL16_g09565 [Triparma laevis f. inornata]|uniref:Metallo-beta-lactamase domain-containing protein n=1 Tax=Triparma laevis f. inornata TaxID=1714386 RepID=A0A9W7ELB8_9STRA|nr:hypothetical protein TL16_g09565 [Triparma laevis f. inornata]
MFPLTSLPLRPLHLPLLRSLSSSTLIPLIHSTPNLNLYSTPVTPLQMNQYLLQCRQTKTSFLIDCGDSSPDRWIETAEEGGGRIEGIMQTHGHVDHVCGLKLTKEVLGVGE